MNKKSAQNNLSLSLNALFGETIPKFVRAPRIVKRAIVANTIGSFDAIIAEKISEDSKDSSNWTKQVLNQPVGKQLAFIKDNPPPFARAVGRHFKPL